MMGGDKPPSIILDAVQSILSHQDGEKLHCVLFCTPNISQILHDTFSKKDSIASKITVVVCKEAIGMDEEPLKALRTKKETTISQGIHDLARKEIDAFISCGNTGALVGASALWLPRFPGISRPGLLSLVPSKKSPFAVIDLGGLVSSKAEHLVQFAFLGTAFQKIINGIEIPHVALLNIGAESQKGTNEEQKAWHLLHSYKEAPFLFQGNVEGRDVFEGNIHVLLTNGFAGNIFLKTAEGIAAFTLQMIQAEAEKEKKVSALLGILSEVHRKLSYEESFGAIVAGVEGLVIKCHGSSSLKAICNAMHGAKRFLEQGLVQKMRYDFASSSSTYI